ncbi:MAG: hypothetical protein OYH76_18265 [Defluviicoccus sp.]|nr:hypothetical protein [Defluviicoccus sp.]MDE0277844.1 hypothetical protein [Defluviicoccus sp.]
MNAIQNGSADNGANRSRFLDFVPVGSDFVKFFASSGVAAATLAGFSYTNEYFHHFGISLFDLDVGYLKMIASAGYLLQDYWVLFGSVVVVALFSLAVAASRYFFGSLGLYCAAALLFLIVCYIAVQIGNSKAFEHTKSIIAGETGRVAYCKLKDTVDSGNSNKGKYPKEFKQSFEKITDEGRMVKIIETKESIYLFPVPEEPPEDYNGESINIQKSDLLYCRVMGN